LGQQWTLNKDIQAAGYTLRIGSVTRTSDGYAFTFQNGADVLCVDLVVQNRLTSRGECGSTHTKLAFDGEIPSGDLTVTISNLEIRLTGPWQVSWTPSAITR
jgi:hypothetical protein